jgi:ribosomal protein S6--L-glutamate ligase
VLLKHNGAPETMELVTRFILGWEEWAGLPDLGLPSLKAKVDTGAKTSALHARMITPFDREGATFVSFLVQPVPRHPSIEVSCTAQVVDQRAVTSSNGETEFRYVVATNLEIGVRRWPIELTLTNRETMNYRMLIGRQALMPGTLVDPLHSFHQARRSHRVYRRLLKPE